MNYALRFDYEKGDTMYLTHSLHPYPAKFPPQLPRSILSEYGKAGQTVLDPFCGSGTTLVEARLFGCNAIGVDINGLSTLLSKVKSTPLSKTEIGEIENFISRIEILEREWAVRRPRNLETKNIEGLSHWFQTNVAEELTCLLKCVDAESSGNVRDFLKIVVSSIIVKVSNQESDTRFAAKNKHVVDNFTLQQFLLRAREYVTRIAAFSEQVPRQGYLQLFNADSRNLQMLRENSIDLIITSPPYANTYDYYLYHKFRKRWLDIDVKFAQNNEIGSRREYSSLKRPAEQWTNDLKLCFAEMSRVLKRNGHAFIVIGDSVIQKELIKIDEIITAFLPETGFGLCNIISSELSGHSRMFNPSYAQKGKKEHLIILKKIAP